MFGNIVTCSSSYRSSVMTQSMYNEPKVNTHRAAERIEGAQGKYKKWGPIIQIVEVGSGDTPPGNFEILQTLKCIGFLRLPLCMQTVHTYLHVAVFV